MTLNPESATSHDDAKQPPTAAPAPAAKSSRRRPQGLFSGPGATEAGMPPPPSNPSDLAEPVSGSESPDDDKQGAKRRRAPAASSVSLTDRAQLKGAIAAGVGLVGVQLHEAAAARDELAAAEGLWLTDDQDREGIADPLSSIAARRGGPGLVNPDLGDAIAALIALVAYLSKNLNIRAKIRAIRKRQPTDEGAAMQQQPEEPAA